MSYKNALAIFIFLLCSLISFTALGADRLVVKDDGGNPTTTITNDGTINLIGSAGMHTYSGITGRMDIGYGGSGGGNLECYSSGAEESRKGSFVFVYGGGNFGNIGFSHYNGSGWTTKMQLTKDGELHMLPNGSKEAWCDGYSWSNASSREFKEDIQELTSENALDALLNLDPVTFKYKGDKQPNNLRVGFIAEDVPELVASPGRKSLDSMDIIAVLTRVVKEQQKTIDSLNVKMTQVEQLLQAK